MKNIRETEEYKNMGVWQLMVFCYIEPQTKAEKLAYWQLGVDTGFLRN